MPKKIVQIHDAVSDPVQDLSTYRALPTRSIPSLDPFLLINHHGYQEYPANNNGLPFGPHPHRGFETLTFIFDSEVVHKDSTGQEFTSGKGGAQWMTAGSGIIHSEVSSEKFKREGGPLEVIQLWMNLPKRLKWTDPWYSGFTPEDILTIEEKGSKWNIISGEVNGKKGPVDSLTGLMMSNLELEGGASFTHTPPSESSILLYVVRGEAEINGRIVSKRKLIEFEADSEGEIMIQAKEDSLLLYCYGNALKEPVASYGPFVMNTQQEIQQAIHDYQNGKFK